MAKYILKTREKDDFWLEYRDENCCSVIAEIKSDDDLTGKLSLKNCQAIERGYDLDELAEKEFPLLDESWCRTGAVHEENLQLLGHRNSFQKGFQKCLELIGDKKFSEDDMKFMFDCGRNYQRTADIDCHFTNAIKSLQQTEWEVEIEMEKTREPKLPNWTVKIGGLKLDSDGCLILKRII